MVNPNGTWTLSSISTPSPTRATYITQFPVYLDANGLITQSGGFTAKCSPSITSNCITKFTRQVIITRPIDFATINVESVVTWTEPGIEKPYEIRIPYTLYNWKYQFYRPRSVLTE